MFKIIYEHTSHQEMKATHSRGKSAVASSLVGLHRVLWLDITDLYCISVINASFYPKYKSVWQAETTVVPD